MYENSQYDNGLPPPPKREAANTFIYNGIRKEVAKNGVIAVVNEVFEGNIAHRYISKNRGINDRLLYEIYQTAVDAIKKGVVVDEKARWLVALVIERHYGMNPKTYYQLKYKAATAAYNILKDKKKRSKIRFFQSLWGEKSFFSIKDIKTDSAVNLIARRRALIAYFERTIFPILAEQFKNKDVCLERREDKTAPLGRYNFESNKICFNSSFDGLLNTSASEIFALFSHELQHADQYFEHIGLNGRIYPIGQGNGFMKKTHYFYPHFKDNMAAYFRNPLEEGATIVEETFQKIVCYGNPLSAKLQMTRAKANLALLNFEQDKLKWDMTQTTKLVVGRKVNIREIY